MICNKNNLFLISNKVKQVVRHCQRTERKKNRTKPKKTLMKFIRTILLSTILFFFFNISYCQQKTVYEKKVEELSLQLFKKLGVSQTQINKAKEMGEIEAMFMVGEIMQKFNTIEGLVLLERFNNEIKKAESLKTEVDFKKDKIKKQKEIALKEAIDQESNKQKLLTEFNNSDYSKISKNIKFEFEKWLTKNEYEKQENFLKRVKENCRKSFDSICNSILLKEISNNIEYNNLTLEVGEYNADKEYFKIIIKIFNTQIDESLNVKLVDAKEFKENSTDRNYRRKVIIISNSLNQWCFNNNQLIPTVFDFNIHNKDLYDTNYVKDLSKDISTKLTNKKALVFNTIELNIKYENFEELNFDFNAYNENLKKISEQENIIYDYESVEIKPEFEGGQNKLMNYIYNNVKQNEDYEEKEKYPKGKVKITYVVERDGTLSGFNLLKGIGAGAGEELIRVLKYCPNWKPGEINGIKVRVQDTLSIKLRRNIAKDYHNLIYRDLISNPQPVNKCKEEGSVRIRITVDGSGNVIEAVANEQDNINISNCLLEEAKISALNSKFDDTNEKMYNDKNMSEQERYNRMKERRRQKGEMYYHFEN